MKPPFASKTRWYREPMIWLVVSGPLVVVVASLVTAAVAWQHIDPVIQDPVHGVVRAGDNMAAGAKPGSPHTPAQMERNHSASPQR
jgi:uncharacterized protein